MTIYPNNIFCLMVDTTIFSKFSRMWALYVRELFLVFDTHTEQIINI